MNDGKTCADLALQREQELLRIVRRRSPHACLRLTEARLRFEHLAQCVHRLNREAEELAEQRIDASAEWIVVEM
jgi:hypothetical protein